MCDLGLGPLTSFVIYSSKKSRRELLFDYAVVGISSSARFSMASTPWPTRGRPTSRSSRTGWKSCRRARSTTPTSRRLRGLSQAAEMGTAARRNPGATGSEGAQRRCWLVARRARTTRYCPQYYVPYEQNLPQIQQRALPVSELEKRHPEAKPLIANAVAQLQIPVEKLVWLPVKHRKWILDRAARSATRDGPWLAAGRSATDVST